jgi:hypothetical protein
MIWDLLVDANFSERAAQVQAKFASMPQVDANR